MARIRTIKPDFWQSESIGRLSRDARLLFLACLNASDDEGLLRWNEAYLMSQAFPYDELSTELLSEWMNELVRERLMYPYTAGAPKQRLAWIVKFRKHQVINRPQASKLLPPSIQNKEVQALIFERDEFTCHICGERIADHGDPNVVGSKVGSIDHLNPLSKGGGDHPSNLKTAHLGCNRSRGNKPLNDSLNTSRTEVEVEVEGKGKGINPSPALTGRDEEIVDKSNPENPAPVSPPAGPAKKVHGTVEDQAVAKQLFEIVRKAAPTAPEPNWDIWANAVRLMREIDGHTHTEQVVLMRWVEADKFWRTVVLSPGTLRAKWTQLEVKRRAGSGQEGGGRRGWWESEAGIKEQGERFGLEPKVGEDRESFVARIVEARRANGEPGFVK